ncbi:MAG: type I glyceraldehyde-3-phosphate dehydrogenase [Deltaproteobacteria bacterium GWA2_38_16]|nr:MAG: type I glyceraldehyde-3-phosphate dehydrogenase [Deltaproteobacteria bacterium GWA2_38_16]OGQ02627.1 MAG: type I glyceraldehyde-3-phosphate dehydrogenase [Deltaproteobacteria bacterium RIFCSPHIGHO2_02_FULL_38_15]HBQ20326.1 type I glyceraldehyde-3-phosphate dehydrogenase [Deltaproteobacteria bacterium]
MIRVAINGFGRIGRQLLRLAHTSKRKIEVMAINDLSDVKTLAHLLKYDSVHGTFEGQVQALKDRILVNGKEIIITAHQLPESLPWKELKVDLVFECTGHFVTREAAKKHMDAGAQKVLVSAPCKDDDLTVVMGINEDQYDAKKHHIVSNASCTTNCLGVMVKVLRDHIGIEKAFMTTIHSYTNDQRVLDLAHKDLRRARAAGLSMIPTSSGATKALFKVFPELKGALQGLSIRVPTPNVSIVDLVAEVKKTVTADEINDLYKKEAQGKLKRYLGYCDEPLVSADFVGDERSAVIDALSTQVSGDRLVKVIGWYDNEVGFSARMLDLAEHMYAH